MPEDGEHLVVEPQSNTGKWMLVILAILFVAGSVYAFVTTQQHVAKLSADLSASQAQVAELQKYLQTDSIITDAESPNGFGIKISLRKPLLEALAKFR